MKRKLVLAFLIIFVLVNGFGQDVNADNNQILKELQSIRDILQSITEDGISQGRLVPLTWEIAGLSTDIGKSEFEKLGIYLVEDLTLTRRPDRTHKVVNGMLVIDEGNTIETVTVLKMSKGKYEGWLVDEKTNKRLLIVSFPGLNHKLYFLRNLHTNRFEFHSAEGITYDSYQSPNPNLYVYIYEKNVADFEGTVIRPLPFQSNGIIGSYQSDRRPQYIMDRGVLGKDDIVSFILQKSTAMTRQQVDALVGAYIKEAQLEGINHDIAIAQLCYATKFLDNQQLLSTYNYAGLNANMGISVQHGNRHADMNQGVRAHIQHLKGYASREPLKSELVDLRYNSLKSYGLLGTVITLDELFFAWSPNNANNYGNEIRRILNDLYQFSGRSS